MLAWKSLSLAYLEEFIRVLLPVSSSSPSSGKKKQERTISTMLLACQQDQNALQRLLAFMLEELCCSIGPVGTHSLLLFGSEILTCEIAVASASTRKQSSTSSPSALQLSDEERLEISLREVTLAALSILFLSDLILDAMGDCWEDS